MEDTNLTPRGCDDDLFVRETAVWLRNPTAAILQSSMAALPFFPCLLSSKTGEEGAVDPVSEQRRQEEKGEAATKDRNMAVVVFLSQTAVILTKRSSSHPRGVRLESPNLSAALLDLVACGRPGLHSAVVVLSVYMPYSCTAMMLLSVFQKRPPCK